MLKGQNANKMYLSIICLIFQDCISSQLLSLRHYLVLLHGHGSVRVIVDARFDSVTLWAGAFSDENAIIGACRFSKTPAGSENTLTKLGNHFQK
jgi:hypothetical protein